MTKQIDKRFQIALLTVFLILVEVSLYAGSPVKIWQEKIVIPTYQVGKPDPNPRFYDGRVTQGAQGRVYPYPMSDVLLGNMEDQRYDIVYLENDFIKISVIPELGGRIFTAVDKTNDYDFFYRQSVIKPALIGTLGKWISGGSEWNFPHHHKTTTMMRMDHYLEQNEDGSATLWLAETERRHRFRITLSLTLYPDRSYIEMQVNPYNPTPFVHSFLYFANPAVHVDSTYQVIFPPNVEYVTQHAKREFIQWPVADGRYGGKTYQDVDISWWKNLSSSVSFFAWNDEKDFFAGYDHGKEAGVAYVSDHHTAPGMKFFTFGCGEAGAAWDKRLTDSDGPYLELMAGVYSDNQPDYSWCQPYENKLATQYWYPIRELGGMQHANLNGALNIDLEKLPLAAIHLNTTSEHKNARAVLLAGDELIWEKHLDIGPAQPFSAEIQVPAETDAPELILELFTEDEKLLISYKPEPQKNAGMPDPAKPPPSPEEITSVEELYLAGLRLDQFHNAQMDPYPYYEEALNRDPGNYLVNTQLGILDCKGFRWEAAEKRLKTAMARITYNHTRPRDGESWYYLGICLREQGKTGEAYDAFFRATWSHAWHSAAYFHLAELDCLKRDYTRALDHVNRSLSTNTANLRARNLKTIILRKLGRIEEAASLARSISDDNPLDLMSRLEIERLSGNYVEASSPQFSADHAHQDKAHEELKTILGNNVETRLELASHYGNYGCWEEAIEVLAELDVSTNEDGSTYPMLYYFLGYYHDRTGDQGESIKYYRLAGSMPADYCFPYRKESLQVLKNAILTDPADASAQYYLGNLLFDHLPVAAIVYWEQSREIDGSNPVVHRNLGIAYEKVNGDYPKAIASYERALELKADPRMVYELDILYEKTNTPIKTRQKLFQVNQKVIPERVDVLTRQVLVYIQSEQYDRALALLHDSHFYRWEGGREIRQYYEDACLLRGLDHLQKGSAGKALEDFNAAMEYPENLEEGRPEMDKRFTQIYYYAGLANERLGKRSAAKEFYQKAVGEETGNSEYLYYRSLACEKLGDPDRALQYAQQLRDYADKGLQADFFAKFGERGSPDMIRANQKYLDGLASLALGNTAMAGEALSEVLTLNPNHSWARIHLDGIGNED